MMSNYQRTLELTSYATNSAGASQKQFEKTTESLESKLNKLHNAWEQFTTGIANQTAVKGIVDLLTNLLTIVNNVTSAVDPLNTGWSKLLTTILGFKAAKSIVSGVLKGMGQTLADGAGIKKDEGIKKKGTSIKDKIFSNSDVTAGKMANAQDEKKKAKEVVEKEKERNKLQIEYRNSLEQTNKKEQENINKLEEQNQKLREQNNLANKSGKEGKKFRRNNNIGNRKGQTKRSNFTAKNNAEIEANENKIAEGKAKIAKNQDILNRSTEEGNKLKEAENNLNIATANSQNIENRATNLGILGKIRMKASLLFGNKQKRLAAMRSLGLASAEETEDIATQGATAAQSGLNAAIAACPIGWIIAGIALVVGAIAGIIYIAQSGERRLKELNETVQHLGDAAREATTSVNDLKDSWEDLVEKNNKLDNLTKGTLEWKQQLLEINQTVLDLMNKYPRLVDYIEDTEGKLSISEAGMKVLEEDRQSAAETLTFANVATQVQQVMQKAKNEGLYNKDTGEFEVQYYWNEEERLKKETSKVTYEKELEQKTQLLLSSAISKMQLTSNTADNAELQSIIESALGTVDYSTKLENLTNETREDKAAYATLIGLTEKEVQSQIDNGELTSQDIKTALASQVLLEQIQNSAQDISSILLARESDSELKHFLQNGLTRADYKNLAKLIDENDQAASETNIREYLKQRGFTDSQIEANFNLSTLYKRIRDNEDEIKKLDSSKHKNKREEIINAINSGRDTELSISDEKKIEDVIVSLIANGMTEKDISSFSEIINQILSGFGEGEEAEKAKDEFVKNLLKTDFSSLQSVEEIFGNLNALGYSVSDNLQEQFKNATKAVNNFSLQNVSDALQDVETTSIVKEKVESDKASDKEFTDEQYQKVVSSLKRAGKWQEYESHFVKDPSSSDKSPKYSYKGDLKEIEEVLKQSAEEQEQNATESLEAQYKTAKNIEELSKTDKGKKIIDSINNKTYFNDSQTSETTREELHNFLSSSPVTTWAIDLNKESGVASLDPGEMSSFISELLQRRSTFNSSDDYYKAAQDIIVEYFKKGNANGQKLQADDLLYFSSLIPDKDKFKEILLGLNVGFTEEEIEAAYSGSFYNSEVANQMSKIVSGFKESTEDYEAQLQELVDNNIISEELKDSWVKLTPEQIYSRLQQIVNPSQSTAQIENDLDALASEKYKNLTALETLKTSPTTNREIEAQKNKIDELVESHEGWKAALEKIKSEYNLVGKSATDNAKRILAARYELNSQVDEIKSVLSNSKEALKTENAGTDKYYEAITKIADAFKVIYGDDIDTGWVERNLETIKKISNGGIDAEAAFEQLEATAEANPPTIKTYLKVDVEGNAKNADLSFLSDKLQDFYKLDEDKIVKYKDSVIDYINDMKSAINTLNDSNISIQAKADVRAALGEIIKLGLAQAKAKGDAQAVEDWLDFAEKNDFSISGIKTTYTSSEYEKAAMENRQLDKTKKVVETNGKITVVDAFEYQQESSTEVSFNTEGTGSNISTWTNDWDRQYSTLKKIESLEKRRNQLSKQQTRYQNSALLNEQRILENKEKQRKNLEQQVELNEQLVNDADSWLQSLNSSNSFGGAIYWDASTGTLHTDDAYIRSLDESTKSEFDTVKSEYESYISQRNTALDNIDTAVDAIEDLTSTITELDYHNNIERLISVIERTIDLYDKAQDRLEWSERSVTSQGVADLYSATGEELVKEFEAYSDDYIQTSAEINAKLHKSDYQKYFNADWTTGEVTTTAAYDALIDTTAKDKVKDFVTELNNLFQRRNDADTKRIETQDKIRSNQKDLLDEVETFQKNVYDAIVSQREAEISNLESINTSIQNAASDLVSSIQKNIQKIRQDRTNKKTEEEISKMQSRLDFLQMDTSSGNQKTILDLKKQLEDKEQSYTDSLIDQKISELQDQNTEAEKQRKKQIEIAQAQLDYQKNNGLIWGDALSLISAGLAANGNIEEGSELDTTLKEWGKYYTLSEQGKKDWLHEQNLGSSRYKAYYDLGLKSTDYNDQVSYSSSGARTSYEDLWQNMINSYKQGLVESINNTSPYNDYMYYNPNTNIVEPIRAFPGEGAYKDLIQNAYEQAQDTIDTIRNINAYFEENKKNKIFTQTPTIARYATGGLADYTGPAWLDGTPSSPELVLNARDTQNFIQLKDVLSNIMNRGTSNTDTSGDYYFEIHIDVDKITNDYDVDKMAERIKQQITNSARYRNVNAINSLR